MIRKIVDVILSGKRHPRPKDILFIDCEELVGAVSKNTGIDHEVVEMVLRAHDEYMLTIKADKLGKVYGYEGGTIDA